MYDCGATSSDRNVVVLNDIHIDIMDYIVPATCTEAEFRQMWAEFEWENKVAVNTPLTDLHEYLASLLKVGKVSLVRVVGKAPPRANLTLLSEHQHEEPDSREGHVRGVRLHGGEPLRQVHLWRGRPRQRLAREEHAEARVYGDRYVVS